MYWGPTPVLASTHADRIREQRRLLAEHALADAIELRKRLWDEATEHVVTRDGVESVVTELPNSKAVRDLADAVERLTRVAEHAAGGAQDATAEAISMLGRLQAQMRQKDSDT
ncbi:MAG TPA: hypothetical protein DIW80_03865 [Gordonia polyisoprenivorans]|uniref:hypothetical protein n=1 Tax=Gordonia polyisoprenivorans TaxID=84595 RepID=UPI000ED7FF20|nr:hypothetical protein [Gordonia polyisoprenivorans]UZF54323.1 hypothetical protein LH935_16375 [Gordonia polyisoprenivorans]HCS56513.1 hypothetical protein [Gordonia polyisoprenivorans]